MQSMFTRLITHDGLDIAAAEQTVRAIYLEELNVAVAERDSHGRAEEATEEEVANMSIEDVMDGAGCDSYEEFEQRFSKSL